jgi:nucleoside-diphosphate-sugar epimerase
MADAGGIFVTGATGALGPALLAELGTTGRPVIALVRAGGHSLGAATVDGDVTVGGLTRADLDLNHIDTVIHAAADTRFRAPRDQQERTNVQGTRNVLAWARRLPRLRRFIFVSTTCVAGRRSGSIAESFAPQPEFVNFYEATKWHAEQLVRASGLPATIVRLSTAIGGEENGAIGRMGAIHYALRWLHRGLIPMLPGSETTPVDFISTDLAARAIARCATATGDLPEVVHVAAGDRAVPLGELLDFVVEVFGESSVPWRQNQFRRPMVVDRATFEMFQQSVRQSGDVLFRTVLDSTAAFLPALLYPKVYQTTAAEALLEGPLALADWRTLLRGVISRCIEPQPAEVCHA